MRKCVLSQLVLFIILCSFSMGGFAHNHDRNKLVILNWSDYLSPEIVSDFEKEFDAEISQIYFESDEQRTNMLVSNQGEGYDLILCAGIDLATYARNGLIAPVELGEIPNSQYILPQWKTAFDVSQSYGVPYFWGTIGIIYRSDLIQPEQDSWKFLFEPPEKMRGRIGMIADGRDMVSMALKALNYSINSTHSNEVMLAGELLLRQKDFVRSYQYVNLDEKSELLSGDVWASMIYNGDALMVMEHSDDLVFFVPKEGTNIWVDYFAIGAKAKRTDLAYAFLNYINIPKVAAKQALFTHYATPNNAAEDFLPEDFLKDPVVYPPEEAISRSEFYQPLPPRQYLRRQKLSAKVLSE